MNLIFAYLKTTNRQLHITHLHTAYTVYTHIWCRWIQNEEKELEGNIIVKSFKSKTVLK